MIEDVLLIALFNTTILICLKKWGAIDEYSAFRKKWMPPADCYLCMGFWMALAQCLIIFFVFFQANVLHLIVVPMCAAPITNYLTNIAILHDYNSGRR